MFKAYDQINFGEDYDNVDDVFIDYHGAALNLIREKAIE